MTQVMTTATRILNSTLVADGSSDRVLIPIIGRLLSAHCPVPCRETDFVRDYPKGMSGLAHRMRHALAQFPCDILFVHRDAEQKDATVLREDEIRAAVEALGLAPPVIAIVPMRMTEAWLLVEENAIRRAAGNPGGREPLGLPDPQKFESVDAKQALFAALARAKNLNNRRSNRLQPQALRHRVADYLDDLTPLRRLPSFDRFEAGLRQYFQSTGFVHA